MEFFRNTHFNFMGLKFFGLAISGIVIAIVLSFMVMNGINMGIDFSGGQLIQLKFKDMPDIEEIRSRLADAGYGNAVVQADPEHDEVMIRVQLNSSEQEGGESQATEQQQTIERVVDSMLSDSDHAEQEAGKLNLNLAGKAQLVDLLIQRDPLNYLQSEPTAMTPEDYARQEYLVVAENLIDHYRDELETETKPRGIILDIDHAADNIELTGDAAALKQVLSEDTFSGSFSRRRTEMVSAAVGSELAEAALWAIIFSLAGILAYIWVRFNNRFSIAAIAALVHDVTITLGVFTIVGREFNLPIVAALLTIVGYSLNDTIVIFVRIRENLTIKRREAKDNYEGLLNLSINTTLSRTLLTSGTTLFVVLFLFFMGGSVINDFAFTLMIGVFVGTYSSIFIASPILAIWNKITGTTGGATAKVKTASA